MRTLLLTACVLAAAPAAARPPLHLELTASEPPAAERAARFAPSLVASRHAAFLDELNHAENTVGALADQAQHLGSPYRSWLWVTPVVAHDMYGLTFRVDVR